MSEANKNGALTYDYFLEKCYGRYKYEWCKQRGVKPEEVDEEVGINGGECFVCLEEFEENEFQNEEYMKSLLSNYELEWWEIAIRDELPHESNHEYIQDTKDYAVSLVSTNDNHKKNLDLDKEIKQAVAFVEGVSSKPHGKEKLGISNIVYMLKESEDLLSNEEILCLTAKIYEASFMTEVPLLTAERVDAVRSLLEYGITENKSPEFPTATREQAKELLLACDIEIFIDLVETVAIDNQRFYAPEYSEPIEERLRPVRNAILSVINKKPELDSVISAAQTTRTVSATRGVAAGTEREYGN